MPPTDTSGIDWASPPFDQFTHVQRLAVDRGGRKSGTSARHHLYVGRDSASRSRVLIKVSSRPGIVYQHDLANEMASLLTINRELPRSRYFPYVVSHGRLRDGRTYLVTSLFDEFPLASEIGEERRPDKEVAYLRTTLAVAKALAELHGVGIYHVDLNPMNILHRTERGQPIVRIVDFESSYEVSRHAGGAFYNPPTTPGYSAPEVPACAPDARSDVFSLGAVLYTLLAGYTWTWAGSATVAAAADEQLDREMREILRRAVATEPEQRYATIDEFGHALDAYLERIWPGRPR